jgi:hypothetical protein
VPRRAHQSPAASGACVDGNDVLSNVAQYAEPGLDAADHSLKHIRDIGWVERPIVSPLGSAWAQAPRALTGRSEMRGPWSTGSLVEGSGADTRI